MKSMPTQSFEEKLRKELFLMRHNFYAEFGQPALLPKIVTTMTQVRGARGAIPTDHAYLIVSTASNG
jgi:hypothetical protein